MPRRRDRPSPGYSARAGAVVWLALAAPGCAAGSDVCRREPVGTVLAFLDSQGERSSLRFEGRLLEALPATELGILRYRFRDASGQSLMLSYRSPLGPLPLRAGGDYTVQVDHVGGSPAASGLAVGDSEGLLFAAAAGQRIGAHVLAQGLDGFTLELLPTACESRRRDRCYEAIHNSQLRISHEGTTAVLHHGESARLGRYQAHCLAAQRVAYSSRCSDAGLHAFAYVIQRIE